MTPIRQCSNNPALQRIFFIDKMNNDDDEKIKNTAFHFWWFNSVLPMHQFLSPLHLRQHTPMEGLDV